MTRHGTVLVTASLAILLQFRASARALLCCCLITTAGTAVGQTLWTSPGVDDWFTPGNWSLGVPNALAMP